MFYFVFLDLLAITSKATKNIYVQVFVEIYVFMHWLITRQLLFTQMGGSYENFSPCALIILFSSPSRSLIQGFFWVHLSSLSLCHSLPTIKEVSWSNHRTHLFFFLIHSSLPFYCLLFYFNDLVNISLSSIW